MVKTVRVLGSFLAGCAYALAACGFALPTSAQPLEYAAAPDGRLPEFNYIKRDTREETRAATLAAHFHAGPDCGPWHLIGPFPFPDQGHLHVPHPPEIDGFNPDATYIGKHGAEVRWRETDFRNNEMMNLRVFGDGPADDRFNTFSVCYLYREIRVAEPTALDVMMGSDDGLKVWLNGRVLIEADVLRGWDGDHHRVTLDLRPGVNRLLVKVSNKHVGWAYSFSETDLLDPLFDAMLEYHLDCDFPRSEEDRYYRIITIPIPREVVLEVGGMDVLPDGRPIIATRRGEVWIVENAYDDPPFLARFKLFAEGLHEPLGLAVRILNEERAERRAGPSPSPAPSPKTATSPAPAGLEDEPARYAVYLAQRGELTRLVDLTGDDRADLYETVFDGWGVSGNYHEFAFGPKFDRDGNLWVTLNLGFCGSLGKSVVPWRGWAVKLTPEHGLPARASNKENDVAEHGLPARTSDREHGLPARPDAHTILSHGLEAHAPVRYRMFPIAGGLRSPNGLGMNADGEMFYTDNQGDWVGTNKLAHLAPGDFHGHPGANRWYDLPESPGPNPGRPAAGPDGPIPMHEAAQRMPTLKLPAVWFPYGRMGQSPSDILLDDTGGAFGPFAGQLFVGDQTNATIMRVFLEKVDGQYQGACFPFRSGFDCGVNRMTWGALPEHGLPARANDDPSVSHGLEGHAPASMFVGMTNRGWGSLGRKPYALQRLVWTGETPFEIHEMRARPDGFELTFTQPVDPATAADLDSYRIKSFTYLYHEPYGSPEVDISSTPGSAGEGRGGGNSPPSPSGMGAGGEGALRITNAQVAPDHLSIILTIDGLRPGYVHELTLPGLRNTHGLPLLHPEAYYTLNRIPTPER